MVPETVGQGEKKRMLSEWLFLLSLLGILILLVWMIVDAAFYITADMLLIQLGIKSDQGMGIRGAMPFDGLGVRVVLLGFLLTLVLTFYGVGCWRAFTQPMGISVRGLLLMVLVAALALFALVRWEQIPFWGFQLRLRSRADAIAQDCRMLLDKWPASGTMVTSLGTVNPPDDNSHAAILNPLTEGYPFRDQFSPLIYQQGKRIIVESQTWPLWKLEYCDDGETPNDFRIEYDGFAVGHTLLETRRLSSHLYLSRYEMESVE